MRIFIVCRSLLGSAVTSIIERNRIAMNTSALLRRYGCCIASLLLFPGCYITTQSFNHGKLLNPGERLLTHAIGGRRASPPMPREDTFASDDASRRYDSTRYNWVTYTLDYRVGILRKYPFGRGLETGVHSEIAFRGKSLNDLKMYGPPELEFDTRFGLPDKPVGPGIFHHNISVGWIVGYWVDNGWFGGYAAGWECDRYIPYLSARLVRTSTDALSKPIMDKFFTEHDRKWVGRISAGCSYKLPVNYSLLPDLLSSEVSLVVPDITDSRNVGVNGALGIRWMLGQ